MVAFHLFIISTFPLAVPLEWNVLFAYAAVFLFLGLPELGRLRRRRHVLAVADSSPSSPACCSSRCSATCAPTWCRSCPSMRQYAGNWASAMWAFAPGAEAEAEPGHRVGSGNQVDQLSPSATSRSGPRSSCSRPIGVAVACTARAAACSRC